MIEALKDFPGNVVAVACEGHVTRRDYETVLVPTVEAALSKHKKIRLYYQIGADFKGIDPGAVWEDFKVAMEHILRWERVAVVTDVEWIRHTMKAFSFLTPAEMKSYPISDAAKARAWVTGD
jgi:hypothetical protein